MQFIIYLTFTISLSNKSFKAVDCISLIAQYFSGSLQCKVRKFSANTKMSARYQVCTYRLQYVLSHLLCHILRISM